MKKRIELNVRIDEQLMDCLVAETKKFNDKNKTNITISHLIRSIIKKYLDKEGIDEKMHTM